eukprot:TRINITY_DN25249_c0_g1_i1.p1 TRINITY_DN25249_c0_g1~~TRINITY_DN25249_c0_g1_i1.p1  ORF type:complete len:175 (-),score=42.70 TRINITY_DN25249_c0_g1_i1:87-611(-)
MCIRDRYIDSAPPAENLIPHPKPQHVSGQPPQPLDQIHDPELVDLQRTTDQPQSPHHSEIPDRVMRLEEDIEQSIAQQQAKQALRETRFQETKADLETLFSSDGSDEEEGGDYGALFSDDDDDDEEMGSAEKAAQNLSLIHISEPTRLLSISYAVFCLTKKTLLYPSPPPRPSC